MKKNKSSTLFYIAAALFFLSAVVAFVRGEDKAIAVICLCTGSTFLCLASAPKKKGKNDDMEKSINVQSENPLKR